MGMGMTMEGPRGGRGQGAPRIGLSTALRGGLVAAALLLAGCAQGPVTPQAARPAAQAPAPTSVSPRAPAALPAPSGAHDGTPQGAARSFVQVMSRMEPAVERECVERRSRAINCDFAFVVDDRPGLEPNAYQTVDSRGRPVVGFTLSLIAQTRNPDEIAFVVGHEAAHHILDHLDRKSGAATAAAVVLGSIASAYGGDQATIQRAQSIGASVGSRYYSKDWELEADYLGAIVTMNAGYNPITGAGLFSRIPDPGNHVLGTHPSRAQRITQVQRAVADVQAGRAR